MNKLKYTGNSKLIKGVVDKINYILDHLISDVKVNGTSVVTDNIASITVPVNTSDLNNDSGFITKAVNDLENYYLTDETYTQDEVDDLISSITSIHFEVESTFPQNPEQNIIYLIPAETTEPQNIYDEWIWIVPESHPEQAHWELIGSTDIDLSNYIQKSSTRGLVKNDGTIDTTTYSTTDEKVKQSPITASDTGWRRILLGSNNNNEETSGVSKNLGLCYQSSTGYMSINNQNGTAGTVNYNELRIGNSTASTSDGNAKGRLRLYADNNRNVVLTTEDTKITGNRTLYLPDKDLKTLAVTDDIPTNTSDLTNDSNFVSDSSYVHTDNNYTTTEKTKLSGIASGAEVNVQSDWNVTSTSSDAFIKNKPTIPTKTSDLTNDSNFVSDANYVHTDVNFTSTLKSKLDGIASGAEVNVQSDWNATSGDAFIKNKPTIPAAQVNSDWNATSGVAQILNKPTIPTVNNATLTIQKNGTNVQTFTANASANKTANITVPTALADLTEDNTHKFVSQDEKTTWNSKSDFSGSYNDLTDKPTIPTVNNATLTIQKNGTNVQTFTANASSNKTANITVPTALSDLSTDETHRVVTDTQISSWDSKGTSNLTLGTSSTTAYRGDRGNTAYTHATDSGRLTTATSSGLYKVGSTAQGHISELVAVEKADITALGIPTSDTNTHRPIQLNGTQILGNNTTVLNLKNGDNISMTNSSGTVTINSTDENVKQSPKTDDVYYKVLLSNSNSNSEETGPANKSVEVTVNPSTGRLRSKRFSVENNEAYTIYPININVTGREASTAGQDIKVLQVQYKTTNGTTTYNHTTYPISVIGNDASNTNNSGVRLGSVNGTTIVGAGECSDDFASAQSHYNDERLYLVADDRIEMYVGLPNAATSYSAYMILGSGVGTGALEAGVLEFGTPDHFVRLNPPSNASFSDVEFPTGGGLLITDNLVKWYSQGNYSGTGGKKLQPKTIEELQFVVHLPSSIDVTINITQIGITASANATSNPGTYQSLRQGYYYASTAFGCVNIWVWINTSNNYIYCQLKEVYQNNTTNIAGNTSYDVYYR